MKGSRIILVGAWTAMLGAIVSGPVSLVIVALTHPQPAWSGPTTFVAAFHPIQSLPYFAGFFLVGGLVLVIAGLHALAQSELRGRTAAALAFAAAFAAMIFTNYVLQTTLVPSLVRAVSVEARVLAAWVTMANPQSLGWGLEMWGYAVLGVATWLAAPVFGESRTGRTARALFIANDIFSLVGGMATSLSSGWVMSPVGLTAFAAWNVLIIAMTALSIRFVRATPDAA